MLRNSAIYQKIVTGHAIPDRAIDLGEHGKIPLVTFGDTTFPKHAWLIKVFCDNTSDRRGSTLIRSYTLLVSCVKMHMAC